MHIPALKEGRNVSNPYAEHILLQWKTGGRPGNLSLQKLLIQPSNNMHWCCGNQARMHLKLEKMCCRKGIHCSENQMQKTRTCVEESAPTAVQKTHYGGAKMRS